MNQNLKVDFQTWRRHDMIRIGNQLILGRAATWLQTFSAWPPGPGLEAAEVPARKFQVFCFVSGSWSKQNHVAIAWLRDQWNQGLSLQVGGTGLTVTGANRVILVDPAWNPSADAQAIDRVHRIGQKQEAVKRSFTAALCSLQRPFLAFMQVVVYRLIGSGAIEDKMFRLQIFKGGLSKTFMEQEQQVRFFTHKQFKPKWYPTTASFFLFGQVSCTRLKSLFEPPNQYAWLI